MRGRLGRIDIGRIRRPLAGDVKPSSSVRNGLYPSCGAYDSYAFRLHRGALGAFDTLYHHELTEHLAWRASQAGELRLHGVRNLAYAVLFSALGWSRPQGVAAILLMALMLSHREMSWRAVTQSDGEMFDGYFLAGMDLPTAQITYHVPLDYWPVLSVPGILTLQRAPAWDGHTPADVLSRLAAWSRAEIRSPADRDTPTVDPRALLAKYIDHVGRCEGVDFLTDRNHGASSVTWTDQEWELLQELRDQEPPA